MKQIYEKSLENKYKEKSPLETVSFIKKIISDLGFETIEENIKEINNLYSCKISLCNNNNVVISTYGKGISKEFCLASGYAELMERIQSICFNGNHFVIENNIKNNKPFYFQEDEKILTYEEIYQNNYQCFNEYKKQYGEEIFYKALSNSFDFIKDNKKYYICVPFKNIFNENIEYIPIMFYRNINTSTGLASGNTYKEAFNQGVSEIIERFVVKNIASNDCSVFPTIPIEEIKKRNKHLYNIIQNIENNSKYKIIIKETSLGMSFPSITIIFLNTENKTYYIKTGVFPVFDIALERCLTEVYQDAGSDILDAIMINNVVLSKKRYEFTEEDFYMLSNFSSIYTDSFLLKNNNNYSLNHFIKANSNEEVYEYYKNLFKSLNLNVYIRDESRTDFKTIDIYIPTLSETASENIKEYLKSKKEKDMTIKELFEEEEKKQLQKNSLDLSYIYFPYEKHLYFSNESFGNKNIYDLNIAYLTTINCIIHNNYEAANIVCKNTIEVFKFMYLYSKYKENGKSFEKAFLEMYKNMSLFLTYLSFKKKGETETLLSDMIYFSKEEIDVFKILKNNNREEILSLFLKDNLFVNVELEKAMILLFDKLLYKNNKKGE